MPHTLTGFEGQVTEWEYTSGHRYNDPFNNVELDVIVSSAQGDSWRIPAYWAGAQEWRVRFLPPAPGHYDVQTTCSDVDNPDLHQITSVLVVSARESDDPLVEHGPLQVAASKRTLTYADGTPFFWLGDTWWMGLCSRLAWPEDFHQLTADRVAKGFTVIQIVAGLYPDMPGFDERGSNEAGFPWEAGYARINPAYFDMADLRIRWLVRSGLIPCIVGCWQVPIQPTFDDWIMILEATTC